MPAAPGESLLTTVYADVHYLFRIAPQSQPQQQRFAKGSYVYLFHNSSDKRTKLEIANHAGTPDQDAFYGYFDAVQRITHSSKQPNLVTVVLEQARITTQSEWHLSTWDERNEKRWTHKLHTLHLYFWTERDALAFVNQLRNIVSPEKLDVGQLPNSAAHSEHRNSMSPVVQQLEKTAITSHYPPRATSATSAQSLPGPPTPASGVSAAVPPPPPPTVAVNEHSAPAAYNPAAPAAPEPIAHREKTPPPPDGATGTGLTNAARYGESQGQPYQQYANYTQPQNASSLQNTPQSSYFPGVPQNNALPPPPPQPSQQPQQSGHTQQSDTPTTQYASYPSSNQYGSSVTSPGLQGPSTGSLTAPPAYGTHTTVQSPGLPGPPGQPSQAGQPSYSSPTQQAAQIAGYSSYSYSPGPHSATAPGQYNPQGGYSGNTHSQHYRPTEGEAPNAYHNPAQYQQPQTHQQIHQQTHQPQGLGDKYKISERVNQMEKGIGGFLKKLDKKF